MTKKAEWLAFLNLKPRTRSMCDPGQNLTMCVSPIRNTQTEGRRWTFLIASGNTDPTQAAVCVYVKEVSNTVFGVDLCVVLSSFNAHPARNVRDSTTTITDATPSPLSSFISSCKTQAESDWTQVTKQLSSTSAVLHNPWMPRLAPKWFILAPNVTNPFWPAEPKCTEIFSEKFLDLTHVKPKSGKSTPACLLSITNVANYLTTGIA